MKAVTGMDSGLIVPIDPLHDLISILDLEPFRQYSAANRAATSVSRTLALARLLNGKMVREGGLRLTPHPMGYLVACIGPMLRFEATSAGIVGV